MTLTIREQFVALLVALVIGAAAGFWLHPSPSGGDLSVTLSHPAPNVATLQVPVPVVTEKIVKEYVRVEDRATINALLEENRKLKVQVQQLSVTVAESRSTGAGTATVIPATPVTPATPEPTPAVPARAEFKDWRLTFTLNGTDANYTLTQKFVILNTVGKNKKNVPTQLIRLFEVGPQDRRTEIPTVETTTIAASENLPHLFTHLTIQAGLGATFAAGSSTSKTPTKAGIVVASWLKRGRTIASEDTRWSYFAPAVSISNAEKNLGVVPIAFNIGSLPKQPFTNIWITPFVGTPNLSVPRSIRIGIFGTATF